MAALDFRKGIEFGPESYRFAQTVDLSVFLLGLQDGYLSYDIPGSWKPSRRPFDGLVYSRGNEVST